MRYEDPQASLPPNEDVRGVRVHRVSSTKFGRSGTFGRALDYLSLYRSLRSTALGLARTGDILVAKTDPPMLSVVIADVAQRRGAHLINWLQDLYPEVAVELGVPFARGALAYALSFLRDRSLRGAAANAVLGDRMADKVRAVGVRADQVRVIHNWSDNELINPVLPSQNPLRREWNLSDKFVVG